MTGRWVRVKDISDATELPVETRVALLATAVEELGVAYSLTLIHGVPNGLQRYADAGGRVRQDAQGEPVIWAEAGS